MKFASKLGVSAIVLIVLAGFLMATNMWDPSVVSFTRHVVGDKAASALDTTARGSVDASKKWVDEAKDMTLEDLVQKARELPAPEIRRIPKYDREAQFGTWVNNDLGCSTRQMILARDLDNAQLDEDDCTVLSGTLTTDPYSGKQIDFISDRAGGDSRAVQTETIVPPSVAWRSGASTWTQEQRAAFMNDPDNLISVGEKSRADRSDKTPDRWMPANKSYGCSYAEAYTNVTVKYGLSLDTKTRNFLVETLAQC